MKISYNSIRQKKENYNLAEYLNRQLFREAIWVANRYMKYCSTSMISWEMQIKPTNTASSYIC